MGVFTKLMALIIVEVQEEIDRLERSTKGITTIKLDIAEPSLADEDVVDAEVGFGFQVSNDKTNNRS